MRRFSVGLALLFLALVSSAIHEERSWKPARIGEHWILEGDVHVHTSFAGAVSTPFDIPLLAQRKRLDFVAVTEHNAWFGGFVTKVAGSVIAPGVLVLPSEEITNRAYHVLAIGLERRVDPTAPLSAIADDVHRQGGVVIAAHPTRSTWPLLLGLADEKKLDGAEVFHPTMLQNDDRAREHAAFLEEASRRAGKSLMAVGSSDFHGGTTLGACRTIVFASDRTTASVREALAAGRAVAVTSDGRIAGDSRWTRILIDAGYRPRTPALADAHAQGLASAGSLASLRWLAWLRWVVFAALGLALVRRPLLPGGKRVKSSCFPLGGTS